MPSLETISTQKDSCMLSDPTLVQHCNHFLFSIFHSTNSLFSMHNIFTYLGKGIFAKLVEITVEHMKITMLMYVTRGMPIEYDRRLAGNYYPSTHFIRHTGKSCLRNVREYLPNYKISHTGIFNFHRSLPLWNLTH